MKTLIATLMVKTLLGYYFIQQIKDMNNQTGVVMPDEPVKEILMAAFFPNALFLVIGLLSLGIVWGVRSAIIDFQEAKKDY